MKLNENIKIFGEKVVLIPYEEIHVEKYHRWMQDHELRKLTCSELLTLQEEYEMQKSWREDDKKCTFLIASQELLSINDNETFALVGDTNIFLLENNELLTAEIEIMIAEKSARGKKLGLESLVLMLLYGIKEVKIRKFIAKIGESNIPSLNLFKKLKFAQVSKSVIFQEITMEKIVTDEWRDWLNELV